MSAVNKHILSIKDDVKCMGDKYHGIADCYDIHGEVILTYITAPYETEQEALANIQEAIRDSKDIDKGVKTLYFLKCAILRYISSTAKNIIEEAASPKN